MPSAKAQHTLIPGPPLHCPELLLPYKGSDTAEEMLPPEQKAFYHNVSIVAFTKNGPTPYSTPNMYFCAILGLEQQ